MSDEKVRDLEGLTDLEIRRALLGAIIVSTDENNGKGRSLTFSHLAAAAQRQNALSVESERILLVEYTGQSANNRASIFNTNNESDVVDNELAIRTGSTRHSFDDGYYAIEVHFYDAYNQNNSRQITVIPIESFNSSDFDNRQSIGAYFGGSYSTMPRAYLGIFRRSATAFGLHGSQGSGFFIQYIYGLRLNIG